MIVGMRTRAQAAKVAALTGGVQLGGKPTPDGTAALSRYVEVGADVEVHRQVVESVSVLFGLYGGDADSYGATGSPGAKLPTGWIVTAAKFEVEWPAEPDRAALVRSHFGARRFAFNWGLAHVKADLDAKAADPGHESVGWDLASLRTVWNRAKHDAAPWWATNSKECYSAGLADLAQALRNWDHSRNGHRSGRRVGFRGSNPLAAILAGCDSAPAPCASKMTGARSRCPSSAAFKPRRTPAGCNAMSPRGGHTC
jgi:putative transposase